MLVYNQKCPECSGVLSQYDEKGEIICHACGLVLDDKLITTDIPMKSEEDGGGRDGIGPPTTYGEVSLGLQTNIGNFSDLKQLPSGQRRRYERLRIQQNRIAVSIERNLKTAIPEIKRMGSLLNLRQSVEEEAQRVYREASYKGVAKGRTIESVAAAAIYAACRSFDTPISLKDIEKAQGTISKKDIGRTYRLLSRVLNLKMVPQLPHDYIPRICGKLSLSAKTQTDALGLLAKCSAESLSGKSPMSVASAVVYISSLINKEKRTQQLIARASGVTEVTLRNRYKQFIKILDITPEKIKKMRFASRQR